MDYKMDEVLKFLQGCGTFYIATAEGDQPRVRPFGAVHIYDGKMYICTNRQKPVSQQMKANPKIEISAASAEGKWLRLTAEAVLDDRVDARRAMLESVPSLRHMYKEDDGIFEVYYLKNANAVISSFGGDTATFQF
jgi:uncharacterized pyridoxamine 5'-phosphate oxidase family protein